MMIMMMGEARTAKSAPEGGFYLKPSPSGPKGRKETSVHILPTLSDDVRVLAEIPHLYGAR